MDIIAAPTNGYICVNVGGVEGGGAILGCRKKIEGGGIIREFCAFGIFCFVCFGFSYFVILEKK